MTDTLALAEVPSSIIVYLIKADGIEQIPSSNYSVYTSNSTLKLLTPPATNELVIATSQGVLLFESLYALSNLATPEQRSIVDTFYIIADSHKLANVNISSESYFLPSSVNISIAFSVSDTNYSNNLTIAEISKGTSLKIYCKATVPPNTSVISLMNFAIVVNADEVPE